MDEIRKGLEKGLDITIYAKPGFNWIQMQALVILTYIYNQSFSYI